MDEAEKRDLLCATLDQLPFLLLVARGEDLQIQMVSAAGRATVGDRPIDVPLATWSDLLGQQLIERYEEVWRTGVPYATKGWRMEIVGPEGVPVELVIDFTITPVRDATGEVSAVVCCAFDQTEETHRREDLEGRYVAALDLLAELQDAVLPKGLPVPQRVELAARYLLAENETGAGGDWFDAIPLPDGRVVVVVGDVVGHGIEASVTMGELKTLFAEEVYRTGDLVHALQLLESRAGRVHQARGATVCAGIFDPVTGELSYCTAGHPPPVLVAAGGDAAYLPASGAAPLGSGLPLRTARQDLGQGDLLLLYSDGLVERPGRTPAQNTVDLLQVASDAFRGIGPVTLASSEPVAERVCRQTLEILTRINGYTDDITLLALQVVPPVEPMELSISAMPDAVRSVRMDLGDWLEGLRVSGLDSTAVQHAVGELVSNAVEHAYPSVDVDNPVTIRAALTADGVVDVEVGDRGAWREPRPGPSERGRGLALVRGFADELHLEHGHGTRARIRYRPTHPAELLRGRSIAPPVVTAPDPEFAVDVAGMTVRVSGPVDRVGAERLEHAMSRTSRGGSRPIDVDLARVALLTSAGVRVLSEARSAGEVRLIAPLGSPAQHVLDLVHLPYSS